MLNYDRKQVTMVHRWLMPAVLFVFIVMASQADIWTEVLGKGQGKVPFGWSLTFITDTLKSDAALLTAPVLCAFPYASVMIDELRSGMVKAVLTRTDRQHYISSKAAACLVSGALEEAVSVGLLSLVVCLIFMPMETVAEAGMNQNEMVRLLIGQLCRYSCYGALWSLAGLAISLLTMNRMMAWVGPFIVNYLLVIVYERYFDVFKLLYPKEWLLGEWAWPMADAGICIWIVLLCLVFYLIIFSAGKRVLYHTL